jgi:hypothetical protein
MFPCGSVSLWGNYRTKFLGASLPHQVIPVPLQVRENPCKDVIPLGLLR